MVTQKSWFSLCLTVSFFILNLSSLSYTAETQATETLKNATATGTGSDASSEAESQLPTSQSPSNSSETEEASPASIATTFAPPQLTSAAAAAFIAALPKREVETPLILPEFIRRMMKRFGETKAAEALQSLDQLPLGLVMKILLVEMDQDLAADIVAMQRYAQTSDKTLITMIGRIVAGDKNVPKEIFAMDVKLMKFPWWMRIRERMLNNLEKYVAAYSLVPVSTKTNTHGTSKLVRGFEAPEDGLSSELASAVVASATEKSNKEVNQAEVAAAAASPATNGNFNLESLRLSLLDPIQQQQLLGTLALANAATATNTQAQQLLQQTQQATNINPFLLL